MVLSCHRCDAELPNGSVRGFCAACGAPQITLGELDTVAAVADGGAPPPPRVSPIRWPRALGAAVGTAVLAGLLFALGSAVPKLSLLSIALILGAAGLVMVLYRRGEPELPMTAAIGARIGLATGLLVVAALAVSLATVGAVARFRFHAMGPFDAQWAAQLTMLEARTAASGGAESAQVLAEFQRPEFRAWSTLGSVGLLSVFLLAVTTISGAVVGSLGGRPE